MALSFDSLTAAQIAAGVAAGDFTATEVAQASDRKSTRMNSSHSV